MAPAIFKIDVAEYLGQAGSIPVRLRQDRPHWTVTPDGTTLARVREDQLRAAMVRRLVESGRIREPTVERAFRTVPRHLFLPGISPDDAYRDEAVPTKWLDGVTISSASQPSMMAIMLEQLDVRPGQRVLEIGAGSGYNAALLAELTGPEGLVVSVDIDEDLVEGAARHLDAAGVTGVRLDTADGARGSPEWAPYDRIVLTVGSWDIQPAWWTQLAPGGRLLLPLSVGGGQLSVALDLHHEPEPVLRSGSVRGCAFVRLRGRGAVVERGEPLEPDGPVLAPVRPVDVDPDRVCRNLAEPGPAWPSRVHLAPVDLWDGFGLWLSVREPSACRLLVPAASVGRWPSLLPTGMDGGTLLLLGDDGLAAVEPRHRVPDGLEDPMAVVVRGYGPDGSWLATRLGDLLRRWHRLGAPSAGGMRVSAYPHGAGPATGAAVEVVKRHSRLLLDWPPNPVAHAPIVER